MTALTLSHHIAAPLQVLPEELGAKAKTLAIAAGVLSITDATTFEVGNRLLIDSHQALKDIEAARVKLKKPITELGKAIDNVCASVADPLDEAKRSLQGKVAAYQRKLQEEEAKARREAEEKARQEREAAEQERARLQAIADEEHRQKVAAAEAKAKAEAEELAAVLGTKGHAVLAGLITDAFAGDWSRASAIIESCHVRMHGLEAWTKDGVRSCLAYALNLIRRCATQYAYIEIRPEIKLDGLGIDIPRGGTADLVILCYGPSGRIRRIVIQDHKLGFVYQGEAADHLQLGAYGVMGWDQWRPVDGVEVHLAAGRRHEFSSAHYDDQAIESVRARIKAAVAAARVPSPTIRPSLKACRYCKSLVFCGAAREHIMSTINEFKHFGAEPEERVQLAEAVALAKRFAAEGDALMKLWRAQEAENAAALPVSN